MIPCECLQSTLRSRGHPNRVTSACYKVLLVSLFLCFCSINWKSSVIQVGFWNQGVTIIISFTFAHVFSTGIAFMHHTRVHVFTKLRYLACCCATSCSEQIVVGSGHSAIICLLINDTKTLCSVISIVLCSCITRWQCGKPKRMPNIK